MPNEHATDDEQSARPLFGIVLVAFVAFPGTLTALASGLVVLYTTLPTLAPPGTTVLIAGLACCTGAAIVAHHLLTP